jgi:hypothetical protein
MANRSLILLGETIILEISINSKLNLNNLQLDKIILTIDTAKKKF